MKLRPHSISCFAFAAVLGFTLTLPSAEAATTIYSESFGGTGALNGSTTDVGGGTWVANDFFNADGSVTETPSDGSAFLPFIPAAGNVYTLTVGITNPSGTGSSDWGAVGFAATNTTTGSFWNNNAAP